MAKGTGGTTVLPICTLLIILATGALSQQCPRLPDGRINWGTLPKMGDFSPNMDYENDENLRLMLSGMARGFVNMVTPPATVSRLLEYTSDFVSRYYTDRSFALDLPVLLKEVAAIAVGIIVCLLVGIVYFILILTVGPIFGCCRCCNNCGGKRVQEPSRCPGCMRVFYTVFLLCVTGVLGAGMAYTNFSNELINYGYKTTKPSLLNAVDDVQTFATGSVQQIDYIIDEEYDQFSCHVRADIDNIGTEIADPLVAYLKTDAGVQDALDAFSSFSSDLDATYSALESINSIKTQLTDGTQQLQASLTAVKSNLDNLSCSGCPDSTDLDQTANYSSIPDVSNPMGKTQDAVTLTEGLYSDFANTLDNISTTIDESAQPAVNDVKQLLDDTKQTIRSNFDLVLDTLNRFNQTVIDVQAAIIDWSKILRSYWDYVYYSLIGVTCLTLLIVLFNVIGIAMGTIAYKDVPPTERTRMSNAGGNVLIAGVFFSVIFGAVLILICCLTFAASGSATLACQPLNTLEFFQKNIDKKDFLVPGYYLGDLLLKDSSVNLTASSILRNCQEDSTLYTALHLSKLFTLSDIEKELEKSKEEILTELTGEIDIPTLDLVPDNLDQTLNDAIDGINLGVIDVTALQAGLAQNVTTINLTDFAKKLRDLKASNAIIAGDLEVLAVELERIQAQEVEPIEIQTSALNDTVNQLVALNQSLPTSISNIVATSQYAEAKVNTDATDYEVRNITVDYVDKVYGYADEYMAQVDKQLEEDVGKCAPVRNVYDNTVILACYYIFDAVNTLWFTTGWCAIFILPSMIVAVRLAKYYRIMDHEALPKVKKAKKGASARRSNHDLPLEDLPDDGHHTGHDNIRLVETIGQGGMQPQQNPHYIPDDVINGYDGYNNLGRPMAPPPAYHPGEPLNIPPHDYYF